MTFLKSLRWRMGIWALGGAYEQVLGQLNKQIGMRHKMESSRREMMSEVGKYVQAIFDYAPERSIIQQIAYKLSSIGYLGFPMGKPPKPGEKGIACCDEDSPGKYVWVGSE